ncbi:ankyrin repeat-containing domain protein [Xylaria telfairii]|nr:ankyrin repeat-containing domain protein [Xylaria telfairii]
MSKPARQRQTHAQKQRQDLSDLILRQEGLELYTTHFGVEPLISEKFGLPAPFIPYTDLNQTLKSTVAPHDNLVVASASKLSTFPSIHNKTCESHSTSNMALAADMNASEFPWELAECSNPWEGLSGATTASDSATQIGAEQNWTVNPELSPESTFSIFNDAGESIIPDLTSPSSDIDITPASTVASSVSRSLERINSTPESHVNTAIFLAASNGHVGVIRALAESGADLNARDKNENSALHLAIAGKHQDVVSMLLQQNVHCQLTNADGLTPLTLAAKIGFEEGLRLLLRHQ